MAVVQSEQPVENVVWQSYGGTLQAMRRTQLWRLADLQEISYPKGASKDVMLEIIKAWEIAHGEGSALQAPSRMNQDTFLKAIEGAHVEYDELRADPSTGQTNVRSIVDAIEGVSHFETVKMEPMVPGVETMTMPELRKTAKAVGVSQNPRMKAEDLRAAIRGKDTP